MTKSASTRNSKRRVDDITKIDSTPYVEFLLVSGSTVLGSIVGESQEIPKILEKLSQLEGSPVTKLHNNIISVGQDTYETSREFLMSFRGSFTFLPWTQVQELDRLVPDDTRVVVLVSY